MKDNQDELVPVFISALGSILIREEDVKGSQLTESEVIRIRDEAACIMMKMHDTRKLEESRGKDIDPDNCWHDWQNLRAKLGRTPSLPPGPRFNQVRDDDAEFQQTIRNGQTTLDHFRDLIVASANSGAMPMVKTRLVNGKHTAFMWLINARKTESGFEGELFEVPSNFENFSVGDIVDVPVESVIDWMVNDYGKLHGGFSIRFFREQLPEHEWAEYDRYVGVTSYAKT